MATCGNGYSNVFAIALTLLFRNAFTIVIASDDWTISGTGTWIGGGSRMFVWPLFCLR
jgi:hypothetical protein